MASVSGVNNDNDSDNDVTGLDGSNDEYEYSKDSETSLSTVQQRGIKENGYCSISQQDVQQTKIIHLISGYIRIIIQNVNVPNAITSLLCGIEPKIFLTFRTNIVLSTLCNTGMDGIELKDVQSDTLEHVLKYLAHHRGIKPLALPCPVRSIKMSRIFPDKWDAVYIDAFDKKTIFEIMLAANYMDIKCLVQLASAKIATLIKQMDQARINRIIEEEKYKRDNNDDANDN